MVILIDAEKLLIKTQHPFMVKTLNKLSSEAMNTVKSVHDNPIVNIVDNGEKLKSFPVKKQEQDKDVYIYIPHSVGSLT
jgi:hypothetical protein